MNFLTIFNALGRLNALPFVRQKNISHSFKALRCVAEIRLFEVRTRACKTDGTSFQQSADGQVRRRREIVDHRDHQITRAALKIAHVGPVQSRLMRELLLRPAFRLAQAANSRIRPQAGLSNFATKFR